MTANKYLVAWAAAAALTLGLSPLAGAMTAADVERLGKDLTPNGAERAGNKEGTIPAWTGGLTKPPAGWKPEQGYVDPFKDDKPLFTINSTNLDTYKDKVSPGMQALLKKHAHLSMPIYPSHRTFANPQSVYDATKAQAGKVGLKDMTITGFSLPGTPFPVPSNGVEAMYNHVTRYFGSYNWCMEWIPVRSNGDWYRAGFCEDVVQGQNFDEKQPNLVFSFYGLYDAPATLLGTIYLVRDPIDYTVGERQAWIYNAGQRRVRRAPDLAYDGSPDGYEGMRTVDDYWGFSGAMDRFDWKLVGKREMYIPYNAYKVADKKLKYKDIIGKNSLKPELLRYELHRVWEVEATLKKGMSHVYSKRTFFLDEDSHLVTLTDNYDSRGALWRTQVLGLVQAYDAQTMYQAPWIQHDLVADSYHVIGLSNEREPIVFNTPRKWADFQPDAIRRRGTR
jgi:hypothetical protein